MATNLLEPLSAAQFNCPTLSPTSNLLPFVQSSVPPLFHPTPQGSSDSFLSSLRPCPPTPFFVRRPPLTPTGSKPLHLPSRSIGTLIHPAFPACISSCPTAFPSASNHGPRSPTKRKKKNSSSLIPHPLHWFLLRHSQSSQKNYLH